MTKKYTFESLTSEYKVQRAERFAYIDFRLMFMGTINRSDLSDFFGIAEAAASKELSEYKTLRPGNVRYDRVLRANTILRDTFTPLIVVDAETALSMLANGFNKNRLVDKALIPYQRVGAFPKQLEVEIVSKITRAIHCKTAITGQYISGSSPNHTMRTLLPTAIFYDGQTWRFRGYHREDKAFKTFNFSRMDMVTEEIDNYASAAEQIDKDNDWNLTLPLHLVIHPYISPGMKKAVKRDFGLDNDENDLVITEKAALFSFLVKKWNIDIQATPNNKAAYSFHLKNIESLWHLDCVRFNLKTSERTIHN